MSTVSTTAGPRGAASATSTADSLRKAAILVVSLEEPLAAQLLSRLDRAAVEAVTLEMARLERIDAAEQNAVLEEFFASGLKRLRFLFEDLVRLDDEAIRSACHDEDRAIWALALAGASGPVRSKVLLALPRASADALRHQLSHLGAFRLADAEAAQTDLAERLRRLHDLGRISLPDLDGQEDAVV